MTDGAEWTESDDLVTRALGAVRVIISKVKDMGGEMLGNVKQTLMEDQAELLLLNREVKAKTKELTEANSVAEAMETKAAEAEEQR